MLPTEIINRRKSAEYLGGICLTTLDRLGIPHIQIRRRVFYRKNDLDKWLTEHTFPRGGEDEKQTD
jgi:hypothetical protein